MGFKVSCPLNSNRSQPTRPSTRASLPEEEEGGWMGRASLQLFCVQAHPGSLSWGKTWQLTVTEEVSLE